MLQSMFLQGPNPADPSKKEKKGKKRGKKGGEEQPSGNVSLIMCHLKASTQGVGKPLGWGEKGGERGERGKEGENYVWERPPFRESYRTGARTITYTPAEVKKEKRERGGKEKKSRGGKQSGGSWVWPFTHRLCHYYMKRRAPFIEFDTRE